MGRTLPSNTQIAYGILAELKPVYETLRRQDQLIFDKFFETILQHRTGISNASNLLPIEIAPFVLLLEERKRVNKAFDKIFTLLEKLEKQIKPLLPPSDS